MAYAMPRSAIAARTSSGDPSFIPDSLRCGSTLYYLTWTRVTVCSFVLMFLVALLSTLASLLPQAALGAGADDASTVSAFLEPAGSGRGTSAKPLRTDKAAKARKEPAETFCSARASSPDGPVANWRLVTLGSSRDYPAVAGGRGKCEWKDKTDTQVPFKVCTFPVSQDSQISTYIHREGRWNGYKTELFERILPILEPVSVETGKRLTVKDIPSTSGSADAEVDEDDDVVVTVSGVPSRQFPKTRGRTMVIDIGSNLGFYTLLAAKRGYDVVALDPSSETQLRLLYSLEENNIRVARSGAEMGLEEPSSSSSKLARDGAGKKRKRKAAPFFASRPEAQSHGKGPSFTSARQPVVWVFQNAAADHYSYGPWSNKASQKQSTDEGGYYRLQFISDNPGASSILDLPASVAASSDGGKDLVATVVLNDLVPKSKPQAAGSGADVPAPASSAEKEAPKAIKIPSRLKGAVEAAAERSGGRNPAVKGRKAPESTTETASAPAPAHLESLVPLDLAPQLDPSKVMLIKISAEGFDARILNGMSKFLDGSSPGSSGAPYVMLVYNRDHVKNLGCDPSLLIRTLFDRGYSIFFGGIFIYREAELQKFLKGMGAGDNGPVRSMEMLFVRREMADGF